MQLNSDNILALFDVNKEAAFLDLGCDDGTLTIDLSKKIKTNKNYGVEIVEERAKEAEKKGIKVKKFDLNKKFEFQDNFFDCIHANQVIEHLYDSDSFLKEIYRILKKGGYAIISTENASSWCNIFASILGWQIFSLTNFSNLGAGIGNPFSLHKERFGTESWNHVRIYNYRGLKEYFEIAGFTVEKVQGAGYFPLPSFFGKLDKIHSHFITFKIKK